LSSIEHTSTLQIYLLGEFQLSYGDTIVTGVNTMRLQSLLAYLLLHRSAAQPRHHLAFVFWPDSTESQARTNLRKLFLQLRRALPDADRFLAHDHLSIQWRKDAPYTLDVAELEEALAHLARLEHNHVSTPDRELLVRAANLYRGELLPGCYEDWVLPVRAEMQRAALIALDRLVQLAEHRREYEAGIAYAQRILHLDPLHEESYRQLMRLHALNGGRAAALHAYHTCTALLQRELGAEPDAETQAMYAQLLQVETLPASPPRKSAYPAQPMPGETPLIGRQAAWEQFLDAWQAASRRRAHFLSIAGEAGIGKTRVAAGGEFRPGGRTALEDLGVG
jgi:DNA-binding SARP family transcriptional activator